MKYDKQLRVFFLATLFLFLTGSMAYGQEEPEGESKLSSEEINKEDYEQIVILGTRSGSRSAETSSVPIDVFDSSDLSSAGGGGDMIQSLQFLVPSFASSVAFDGSAFVTPTTMRGGTADQTLVMINGKRRHRSAVLHLFAPPANKGAHGADIGMIPTIAVKNVEVLRDGAAAQYGSDAIAGVVNFALKDASEGGSVEMTYGNHFEGEQNWRLSGNVGTQLCNNGFLNLSIDTNEAEHLSRGSQNPAAEELANQGLELDPSPFNDDGYVQTWGRPKLTGTRFFANSSCKIGGNMDMYVFGNYAQTKGEWSFFYRDINNGALKGTNSPSAFPAPTNLDRAHEVGFTPFLEGKQNDFSLTAGIKGEGFLGDHYDFSVATGLNKIDYTLKNSLNPGAPLGDENKAIRDFDTTDLKQEELRLNADFSKELGSRLTWLYGLEFRQETYTQYAGDFPARLSGGVSGMAGTKLVDEGSNSRDNYALYSELESSLTSDLFVQGALRFENYSDFGSTMTGKVAGHYSLLSALGLRGAISTGFRAPTPGQTNLSTTLTNFANRDTSDPDIEEVRVRHIPANSPEARALGGTALSEEKSFNVSLGAVSRLSNNMSLSVDVYQTTIGDRIYRNEIIGTTQDSNNIVEDWSFYTNALDTRHTGLDVVWTTYASGLGTSFSLAYNYNTVEVTDTKKINGVQVVRNDVKEDIEKNYPNHRFAATSITQFGDKWDLLLRGRYYGAHYDDMGTITGDENGANKSQQVDPILYLDFELAYNLTKDLNVAFGASNFLNTYPNEVTGEGAANFAGAGFNYSALSVAGYEGGSWYLKGVYTF